jgi:SAM-dependent methyltransferase
MKAAVVRFIRSQQFQPGLMGVFVNPFFLARRQLWREIAAARDQLSGRLLDVGCGSQPYRPLFAACIYTGLDIDSPRTRALAVADAFYDGHRFPFDDACFDAVLCNQVLEHVFNPAEFLSEVRRVMTPGARLLLTVPFVWDEHEQPWDYARYSSFGLRALLERHGFRVLRQRKLMADSSLLFQLAIAYIYKVAPTRSAYFNLLITGLLFAPLSLFGLLAGALLPKNEDLFLDQLVVAETAP